jgi:acetyl esterase/lipase
MFEGYRPLFFDLRVPAGAAPSQPAPIVVWVHGGGFVYGSRRRQAPNIHRYGAIDAIVEAGFAVAVIDYRLAKEAPFPAQVQDIRAAVRWLRTYGHEYGIDSSRVAVWGESAGAHLALMTGYATNIPVPDGAEFLAAQEDVQAVVEWYGPAVVSTAGAPPKGESEEKGLYSDNPMKYLLDGTGWTAESASPLTYVHAGVPPTFIAHGREDQMVSVEQGRRLAQALEAAGATYEYFETDGDHVFTDADSMPEVIKKSICFLTDLLQPKDETPGQTQSVSTSQQAPANI